MIVDCDRCEVRGTSCQDCVITVLLGAPPGGIDLDGTERWALGALAEAGVVPRLQLVDRLASVERSADDDERSRRHVG
ncbi:MAG: hypothetical protein ACRDRA_21245 [Pseudonocardiaceae bacterium]